MNKILNNLEKRVKTVKDLKAIINELVIAIDLINEASNSETIVKLLDLNSRALARAKILYIESTEAERPYIDYTRDLVENLKKEV